jgi:hypothetical protein
MPPVVTGKGVLHLGRCRREGEADKETLEVQREKMRLIVLRTGDWTIEHWTPFNHLPHAAADSPGYRRGLAHQHSMPDRPHGLGCVALGDPQEYPSAEGLTV